MAATIVSKEYYYNSKPGATTIIGYESNRYRTLVVEFTVDESATELTLNLKGDVYNTEYRSCNIYGSIGTSRTEWLEYCGTEGTFVGTAEKGVTVAYETEFSFTATFTNLTLLPGTTYYLTLYSSKAAYACIYVYSKTGVALTSSCPVTYAVTYAKGTYDSGEEIIDQKLHGVDLQLRGAMFTREGYVQNGWDTQKDQTGQDSYDYELEGTYSDNVAITLYPFWQSEKYTITFEKNHQEAILNGSNTISVSYMNGGGPHSNVSNLMPSLDGFVFLGYFTDTEGGEQVYSAIGMPVTSSGYFDGSSWAYPGDLTLYAHWAADVYTISYHISDNRIDKFRITPGDSIILYNNDQAYLYGHFLRGWSEDRGIEVPTYLPGETITPRSNLYLYPIWSPGNLIYVKTDSGEWTQGKVFLKMGNIWFGVD